MAGTIALEYEAALDEADVRLVHRLMRDGRATWSDLAADLGLSAPAVAQRVRRLVERGVIHHFAAWANADALVPVTAFVTVEVAEPNRHEDFREGLAKLEGIQECHQVSGDGGYLLKVRCRSLDDLAELARSVLPELAGPCRTNTAVVLETVKESPVLPLFER